jgi:hypothetical protein
MARIDYGHLATSRRGKDRRRRPLEHGLGSVTPPPAARSRARLISADSGSPRGRPSEGSTARNASPDRIDRTGEPR